jgi:hypothetical protein
MGTAKKDQLLGKLDLLVLRILSCGDSMHGYAIAERIEELSENVLRWVRDRSIPRCIAWTRRVGSGRSGRLPRIIGGRVFTASRPPDEGNWRKKKPIGYARPKPLRAC